MIASTYFEFSSWYHNHNVVGDDRQCCPYCLLSASGMLIFVQKTYTSTRALTFVIRNHWQTKYVWCFKKGRAFNETATLKSTAMPVCKTQLHNLEYYQGRWTLSTWHQHFFQIHEIRFLFRKRQAAEWFAEDKLDKCLDTKPIKRIKNRNFTHFTCIYLYCPMAAGDEKRWKTEAGWEKTETDGVPVTAWERDASGERSASISTACARKDRNILFLAHGHSSIMILQVADNRKTERVASRAGRNNIWRFARIELEFPRACPMAMPTSLL